MNPVKVCIVGSGPAGFFAAKKIVDLIPSAFIDIYEKLPVPFGLVRYGVAPDHPEVRNVINRFNKWAEFPQIKFFGNVDVGTDISLKQLKEAYNVMILSYGASEDRKLGIPGENLPNVLSARELVGWYNGCPDHQHLDPSFDNERVSILGQGNVAIDIARLLLCPIDKLKETDITETALEKLSNSKIKQVNLIGRRGPLQAAFTIKELRELLNLTNSQWRKSDFVDITSEIVAGLDRPRKRLTELMLNKLEAQQATSNKLLCPIFYRAPLCITKSSLKLAKTLLTPEGSCIQTNDVEFIPGDLVIRSIGYKSINLDPSYLPFDENTGRVVQNIGAVKNLPGVYVVGWAGFGSEGVIAKTSGYASDVAKLVCEEIEKNEIPGEGKPGSTAILSHLQKINKQVVSWNGWLKIDEYELQEGKKLGKCREKVTDIKKMLEIAS